MELSQSTAEQLQYLKNVELAHVLDKRAAKKKEQGEEFQLRPNSQPYKRLHDGDNFKAGKKQKFSLPSAESRALSGMLSGIF